MNRDDVFYQIQNRHPNTPNQWWPKRGKNAQDMKRILRNTFMIKIRGGGVAKKTQVSNSVSGYIGLMQDSTPY